MNRFALVLLLAALPLALLTAQARGDAINNAFLSGYATPVNFANQVLTTRGGGALYNNTRNNVTNAIYQIQVNAAASSSAITVTLCNSFGDTPNSNSILAGCAITDPSNNTTNQFLFSGLKSVTIAGGALVTSDVLTMNIVAGRTYYVRPVVAITAGQQYYMGASVSDNYYGRTAEGISYNNTTPFNDVATVQPNNFVPAGAYGFVSIRGTVNAVGQPKSIALIGDSIMADGNQVDNSYPVVALGAGLNTNNAYVNIGVGGDQLNAFLTNNVQRMAMITNLPYALCNYGINDVRNGRTFAQMTNDFVTLWTLLKSVGFQRVYELTITPQDTLTSAQIGVRTNVNNWIKTTPAPLDGFFDALPSCETVPNFSNVWIAGLQDDGVHPNTNGVQVLGSYLTNAFNAVFH